MTDLERRATQLASALPAAESVTHATVVAPDTGPLPRWTVSVHTDRGGLGPGAAAVITEYSATVRSVTRQGVGREALLTV